MPIMWIGLAVTAASAGISAYEAASASGPAQPNTAKAARQMAEAESAALPARRKLEAAAQQGAKTNVWVDKHVETKQLVKVDGKKVPYVAKDWEPGGQYYTGKKPKIITEKVKVPAGYKNVDFSGYGEADVQSAVAKQNAATELALREKYDPQFIEEALKQQAEADPLGTAARAKEFEMIQESLGKTPDRPVAELLDRQVGEQLAAGRNLDSVSQDVLDQAVAQAQAARGGGNARSQQFAEPLTTGFAGDERVQAAQAKAQAWLGSGATPEDVTYRRQQQDMANLASFMSGQTPESQFQTISGAQSGPTPMNNGRMPQANPNASTTGNNAAVSAWNATMGWDATQSNDWMSGISTILSGLTAAGKGGLKIGGTSSTTSGGGGGGYQGGQG